MHDSLQVLDLDQRACKTWCSGHHDLMARIATKGQFSARKATTRSARSSAYKKLGGVQCYSAKSRTYRVAGQRQSLQCRTICGSCNAEWCNWPRHHLGNRHMCHECTLDQPPPEDGSPEDRLISASRCGGRCDHCGTNSCMYRCEHVDKHICERCFVSLSKKNRRHRWRHRVGQAVILLPPLGGKKRFLELFSGSGHLSNAFTEASLSLCFRISSFY